MFIRVPTDVPVHRPSVGAMSVTMGSQMPAKVDKPYVYRGTGVDTLTAHLGEDEIRAKPKRKRKRKPKPKPRKPYRHHYYRHVYKPTIPPPTPEMVEEQDRQLLAQYPPGDRPEPEPDPWPFKTSTIRPAPGWQPTSGEDIANLLDGLDDED